MTTRRIGIIAGAGRFPFMVARGARQAGCHVTTVALRGFADPALADESDVFRWSGIARLGAWIRCLKGQRAGAVILAGSVRKADMYGRWRLLKTLPDLTSLRLWFVSLKDKRNDAILSAVADEFGRHGIIMDECTRYCADDIAVEGVLTSLRPHAGQQADAEFGWRIAKEMGRLDIGQSVAVKETEVIAVEAIEGTDRMIERAGQLCPRGGWTLVKVAKPNQDRRFDVPTIGPETIANMARHGAGMLVVEAGQTVIVERAATLDAARRAGIIVVARADEPAA